MVERLEARSLLATLFVDAGNHTGVEDGTQAHPYAHIQAAINVATTANNTIHVAAGLYAESLVVSRPVAILGPNAGINPNSATRGPEAVVVPAANNPSSGRLVRVTASNVTIDGLTFDGHNSALTTGTLINGVTANAASGITNVDPQGKLTVISGLVVQNDIIKDFTLFGVMADINDFSTAKHAVSTGNAIRNNRIDNVPNMTGIPGRGISIEDNFYADVTGNLLTRVATGIQAIFMLDPSGAPTSSIANNEVHAYGLGIYLWTLDSGTQAYNLAANNVFAETGAATTSIGIELDRILGSTGVAMTANNVAGMHVGVELQYVAATAAVNVAGGTLAGNDYGVLLTNSDAPSSGAKPVQATLAGVVVQDAKVAGLAVNDARGAAVTLVADASTLVTGAPHGLALSGAGAHLSDAGTPTVTLTSTPPLQGTGSAASFGFSALDNVSTANDLIVRYTLDGGAATPAGSSPLTLTGLAPGPHAFTLTVTDQAGNSATTSYSWAVSAATSASLNTVARSTQSKSATSDPATTASPLVAPSSTGAHISSHGIASHHSRKHLRISGGGKAHPSGPAGKFRRHHPAAK